MVGHSPHSGRPESERSHWWQLTTSILQKHRRALPVIVLIDANARTGPTMPPHILEYDDGDNHNTEAFRQFLVDHDLCLPATSQCHQGPHPTWQSLNGESSQRIDYVAVPVHLFTACVFSCVADSFDLGNARDDHFGIGLQMTWDDLLLTKQQRTSLPSRNTGFDRAQIKSNRASILWQTVTPQPWACDIHTHVTDFNQQVLQLLSTTCSRPKGRPKKPYLDEEVWSLRQRKCALRARLKEARRLSRGHLLRKIFHGWHSQQPALPDDLRADWLFQSTWQCSMLRLVAQFHCVSRQLRQKIRMNKQKHLDTVLTELSANSAAGDILHHLRPFIGPTNLKKLKAKALPIVKQSDGTVCESHDQARDRWIQFFGQMEGGRRISCDEQWRLWRHNLAHFRQDCGTDLQLNDIPSLVELELAYRRVALGKATGLDGIPSEVCHYFPAAFARLTYTMLMKASIHGQEALPHKGGRLVQAYKHKGDPSECSSHRSLLISSHIGKTLHRSLRQHHYSLYAAYQQRQQVGGRRKMPVSGALHMARAYLRVQRNARRPCAMIFLDLTEAFYRVVRPLAVGGHLSDQCLQSMIDRLGLPPHEVQELHAMLTQPSALDLANAPAHVCRLLQAIHQDTWFVVDDQQDVVRTELGSRPGDGFADVVFGFLW